MKIKIGFELQADSEVSFEVSRGLDTTILYVYEGYLSGMNASDKAIATGSVVLLDASSDDQRGIGFKTGESQAKVLLFAGKKLKEPIAWNGPIVLNTQDGIQQTFRDMRSGEFPPVRVDWDYRRLSNKPE